MSFIDWFKNLFSSPEETSEGCCSCHCGVNEVTLDLGLSATDQAILKNADPHIVVGKILSIAPHSDPNVTKVQVTQCDVGDGKETQILCGGTNIAEGLIIPIAKVGAKLPENFEISVRDIRGETSNGMICAQSELGLSAKNEEKGQIWVLPKELGNKLGIPLREL